MQNNRKIIYGALLFMAVLAAVLFVIIFHTKNSPLKVIFLDVGQGDSILISQGSQQILIDGGKDGKLLLEKLGKHIPFWDRKIESIIGTHPDADHIGGLIEVLRVYEVDAIIQTEMKSQSQTFKKLEELIQEKDIEKIEAKKDVNLKFESGVIAEILYPTQRVLDINGKDTNMYSVMLMLTSGENKFLFTGDLPIEQEKEIVEKNINLKANILKVGHHGSKYSTGEEFLSAVNPEEAVISVGKNNSYGHPNSEVLQKLSSHKINTLRTDEQGDIIYECKNLNEKCILRMYN